MLQVAKCTVGQFMHGRAPGIGCPGGGAVSYSEKDLAALSVGKPREFGIGDARLHWCATLGYCYLSFCHGDSRLARKITRQ